ncbi:RNA polymerase sigma factor [Rhizosphaericola mali]|uniref:Sigma-70 family RNA polymerase sigma factor n=1 Tax=Rhizosphaericola mali TaxID=2545455 RepID=A0A5P2G5H9_9BACT|nr:sigma-70 family RNA polymerase sigma factor [Rhizosphaericola mali]QES88363.1 sigma-70 family RNA polymerase sigma factor [Rhizosphaericola mali]
METTIDITKTWYSFKEGNSEAFASLYNHFYPQIFEYGIRKGYSNENISNAIQDLFLHLWETRKKLPIPEKPLFYLFRSFSNHLINIQNSKQGKINYVNEEIFLLKYDATSEMDNLFKDEQNIQIKKVIQELNELPAKQKEFIFLKYFAELEYDEIAELMNITTRAVYKLNYRALDSLKEKLSTNKENLLALFILMKTLYKF